MTGLRSLPARVLVVLGLSILIAGLISVYAGPKSVATYSGTRVASQGEIVGITVWAMSTSGNVTVETEGAAEVLYTIVKGDPIGFFTNASAFGVHAEAVDMTHDIRSGVFFASARVRLDPLTLVYISKKLSKAEGGGLTYSLPEGESIVLVIVPEHYGEPVNYTITFHVAGYTRLSTGQLFAVGVIIAGGGLAWLAALRVKTQRVSSG
jgi:hypothetical protein